MLRGDTWGQPEIVNVSPDERIQKGESVLTSGGDAIYPRGLSVGTVDRVRPEPEGTLVNVLIKPAANLSQAGRSAGDHHTGEQMPAEMQQNLTEASRPNRRRPTCWPSGCLADRSECAAGSAAITRGCQRRCESCRLRSSRRRRCIRIGIRLSDTPPAADLVPGQKITDGEARAAAQAVRRSHRRRQRNSAAPGTTAKPGMVNRRRSREAVRRSPRRSRLRLQAGMRRNQETSPRRVSRRGRILPDDA